MPVPICGLAGFAPIDEIIEEARQGRPFVLVPSGYPQDEGDVVVPAQFATSEVVNFMARHARGLVRLALTRDRATALQLPLMAANGAAAGARVMTVSIEAHEGVSTGISAEDRARTIAVAADPTKTARDIVSPGHVFPQIARPWGVLEAAEVAEAAVDIAKVAGLLPAGVMCQVMNAEGAMSRRDELIGFAQAHQLKIGTIADLVAFRRASEPLLERIVEAPLAGGELRLRVYRDRVSAVEHLVMTRGEIRPDVEVAVSFHVLDPKAALLERLTLGLDPLGGWLTRMSLSQAPSAAIFTLDAQPSRIAAAGGPPMAMRTSDDPGVCAQILRELGITRVRPVTPASSGDQVSEAHDPHAAAQRP